MKTKTYFHNRERQMLDYVVGDFLEIKASLGEKESGGLKNYLFSRTIENNRIVAVEGFYLGGNLVLLEKMDPRDFCRLICVAPGNGKIQARDLPSS